MVHRCKIQYKILLDLRQVVKLPHLAQSHRRAVNLLSEKVHHRLLIIQIIHLQINLLHKVAAVVSPEQAKSKQPAIVTVKQGLV
jgi:hypothetical protein